MVAGAAAILKSCGVPLNDIESTLRNSANVTVPFPDGSSAPRLDIYRALLTRNRAPTSLSISNTGLNEFTDTSTGTEVGTLTSTDADTCDKFTYSIVGGDDAALFRIGGVASDRLILAAGVLNYASKPSYAVTLRVTDYFGATPVTDLPLTVNVIPVNNAPTIAAQSFTINDNSANGTNVGTVVANDPDSGNTLGYSIASGNTNNAFSIDAGTGALSVNNSTALSSTFSLVVLVTDNFGATASATVTVNMNNAPTISYQTFSINDGSSNGTPVGNVLASDPNGNAVTYSILAGNTNNAFLLDATTGGLSVNNSAALVFATTPSFNLTVRVADGGGLTATATVRVNVNAPVTPPPSSGGGGKPGGGGGCSVMPAGASPDSSLALAVLVMLGYGVRRRINRKRG
jgi:MYXO-CTERM domain-containing protein